MVRAPDPREPSAGPSASRKAPPNKEQPLLRVTAGSPDHKTLLKALQWLLNQPGPDKARREVLR